jgi:hypothetical protein
MKNVDPPGELVLNGPLRGGKGVVLRCLVGLCILVPAVLLPHGVDRHLQLSQQLGHQVLGEVLHRARRVRFDEIHRPELPPEPRTRAPVPDRPLAR